MDQPYISNHRAFTQKSFTASRREEFKTNATGTGQSSYFKPKFNWQKNKISSIHALDRYQSQQSSLTFANQSQILNTSKFYKIISDSTHWTNLSRRMDAIRNTSTTRPFQDVLRLIQENAGSSDIFLLHLFLRDLPDNDKHLFQTKVFPEMAKLVLKTPTLFPKEIAMMTQGRAGAVSLTREQCACLLSHMFMCTTLRQSSSALPMRYNFSQLYSSTRQGQGEKYQVKKQKIACLLNYFARVTTSSSDSKEMVTFSRVHLDETVHGRCDLDAWAQLPETLKEVEIDTTRKIEDYHNSAEVDFANKHLGGGVLGAGAVQEEIQFITRPEQIVGLLFCESMTDKEAILIKGAKIYSGYKGYASTFAYDPLSIFSQCDVDGGSEREVIAIDAQDYSNFHPRAQYGKEEILRELNKAYVGFSGDLTTKKVIATGSWGCGSFQGDAQLKFLLQWMAATRAGRDMKYSSFGKADISGFQRIVKTYTGQKVGKLMQDILTGCVLMSHTSKGLFEILLDNMNHSKYRHL